MCWCGPVVCLPRQDARIPVALEDCQERLNAVARRGHVRDGRAGHILQLEIRPRAMEKRNYATVVSRGCTQSWSPPLSNDHNRQRYDDRFNLPTSSKYGNARNSEQSLGVPPDRISKKNLAYYFRCVIFRRGRLRKAWVSLFVKGIHVSNLRHRQNVLELQSWNDNLAASRETYILWSIRFGPEKDTTYQR